MTTSHMTSSVPFIMRTAVLGILSTSVLVGAAEGGLRARESGSRRRSLPIHRSDVAIPDTMLEPVVDAVEDLPTDGGSDAGGIQLLSGGMIALLGAPTVEVVESAAGDSILRLAGFDVAFCMCSGGCSGDCHAVITGGIATCEGGCYNDGSACTSCGWSRVSVPKLPGAQAEVLDPTTDDGSGHSVFDDVVAEASAEHVRFYDDVEITVDDSAEDVILRINGGAAGGLSCGCDSGCYGACLMSVGPNEATCEGSCSGSECGSCTFRYSLPDAVTGTFASGGVVIDDGAYSDDLDGIGDDTVSLPTGFVAADASYFNAISSDYLEFEPGTFEEVTDAEGNTILRAKDGDLTLRCGCSQGCDGGCVMASNDDSASCTGGCYRSDGTATPCTSCSFSTVREMPVHTDFRGDRPVLVID